jgi:Uma2 family endonuclease
MRYIEEPIMALPAAQPRCDAQTFLDWEEGQAEKHQYLDGEVFAVAGASDARVTIALNVAMALRQHLRGGPCSEFITDIKLRRGK